MQSCLNKVSKENINEENNLLYVRINFSYNCNNSVYVNYSDITTDYEIEENNIEEQVYYIEHENDYEPVDNLEDILDYSSLVIEGTVKEINDTVYIPFVNEELEKKFVEEGREQMYYADIWTYYTIKVDKVLYGSCESDEIIYRCLGGRIENVVIEQEIEIEHGKKYIFYLEDKDGVFVNSLSNNAVTLIEGNEIVEDNVKGDLMNNYNEVSDLEREFENIE